MLSFVFMVESGGCNGRGSCLQRRIAGFLPACCLPLLKPPIFQEVARPRQVFPPQLHRTPLDLTKSPTTRKILRHRQQDSRNLLQKLQIMLLTFENFPEFEQKSGHFSSFADSISSPSGFPAASGWGIPGAAM
jgi:hypothetical protein